MVIQIQFRERGGKRWYNFSHRQLYSVAEAMKMKKVAQKMQPNRVFRIKRR